ncbi:hypothetical protein CNYM01_06056 [Colletotrichum nymphaeae SA-01]|uniref:C2H2-type domain-containing protein n=1 Tax=Colletotrichum nymphaeae SA-01 TaxID=1460502 RepID=A0A135TI59_9PEZI|nr:hypothetical protein CNYM01_06056 [Colletotrichum nymphaeae SA-01]
MDKNDGQDQGRKRRERIKRRRIECLQSFSCPFRKRNPCRFNARDFDACANKSYKSMAELKRHIGAEHGNQSCTYCGQPRTARDHPPEDCLRNRQLESNSYPKDPEDGVDKSKDKALKSRVHGCKIQTWDQLWKLLFPDDEEIPPQTFDPVIEHHDIAAAGCQKFVLKTAEDILDFIHKSPVLSVQALQEIIYERTKALLQGSKYANYECYNIMGYDDMIQMSTTAKVRSVVSGTRDQIENGFDDVGSPGVIVTPQPSPQGAAVVCNSTSIGLKSSSANRERLIAPKIERVPTPVIPQKTCSTPGAFMQNGSPIYTDGLQNLIAPDLPGGDILNWSDSDFKSWDENYGDELMFMEGAATEDFWTSYMVPDLEPTSQPFAGPGSRS